ncbi:MAG: hypothetical protein GX577_16135 [Leptolinea sp.]|nr:hypothetical protein [Leptolinea sp.]
MSVIIVEQNDYGTMYYHPESKIVHHEYHKFIYGDVYRAFLLKGTETLKKYGAIKWLSDDRKNPVVSAIDIEWGQKNWLPVTLQAGWKYWAIVQPEGILAKVTMENLMKDFAKFGLTAKYFTDPEVAMKWLESQS